MGNCGDLRYIRVSADDPMDSETYFSERLHPQLHWLSETSSRNKTAFLRHRLLGIGLGALITILSPYANTNVRWNGVAAVPLLLQLCGAGVALSGALLALNRHEENWLRYRGLKEALECECWLFRTGSSEAYHGPHGFHQFVRTTEDLMKEERSAWMRQVPDSAEPERGDGAEGAAAL